MDDILDQIISGVIRVRIFNKGDKRSDWTGLKEQPLRVAVERIYGRFWPNQQNNGFGVKSFNSETNALEVEVKY